MRDGISKLISWLWGHKLENTIWSHVHRHVCRVPCALSASTSSVSHQNPSHSSSRTSYGSPGFTFPLTFFFIPSSSLLIHQVASSQQPLSDLVSRILGTVGLLSGLSPSHVPKKRAPLNSTYLFPQCLQRTVDTGYLPGGVLSACL